MEQYNQDEFEKRYLAWSRGKVLIEEAFPELSYGQINFIKTGMTTAEWNKYIGEEDA